jgi:hypothetical protein
LADVHPAEECLAGEAPSKKPHRLKSGGGRFLHARLKYSHAHDPYRLCSNSGMTDRPASWRRPTVKQMEKLASDRARTSRIGDLAPEAALPREYWDALLRDPRAAGKPWLLIEQMRLSEIRASCSGSTAPVAGVIRPAILTP